MSSPISCRSISTFNQTAAVISKML